MINNFFGSTVNLVKFDGFCDLLRKYFDGKSSNDSMLPVCLNINKRYEIEMKGHQVSKGPIKVKALAKQKQNI